MIWIKKFSSPEMRNREFVFTPKIEYELVAERSEANQNSLTFPFWCSILELVRTHFAAAGGEEVPLRKFGKAAEPHRSKPQKNPKKNIGSNHILILGEENFLILMIKAIIFDTDGMVIHREMYFSQRFSQEFGVPMEKVLPFFKNEFQLCLIGKADLKQELTKYLNQWNWKKSVDDLLSFWFEHESNLDKKMLESIKVLRSNGIKCYLDTNNEKYRVQYLFENLGLKNFFDGAFSSAELGHLKPQQEFWSAIHDHLGKPDKSEVLVWDDDKESVESAKSFGFHSEFYSGFDAYENRMKSLVG